MKKAAQLTWRGFEYVCSLLKEGITESQLAFEFELFCRKSGAEGLAFEAIIAFGKNTACPHHRSGSDQLKKDDVVLIDVGIVMNHYRSDMTRVIFFGEPDPEIERLYSLVRQAHHKALSLCRPGVKIGDLDRAVRDFFREEGCEELFVHSLGHGLGLDTHEYPTIRSSSGQILKPGMIFTIEPGLYIQGKGGVRYEDTVLMTQDHYENFYLSKV